MPKEDEPEQPLTSDELQRLRAFKFNYEVEALIEKGFSTDEAKNIVLLKYAHPDRKKPYIPPVEAHQLLEQVAEASLQPAEITSTPTEFSDSFLGRVKETIKHPIQHQKRLLESSDITVMGLGILAAVVHGGDPWVNSGIVLGVLSATHGAIRGALRLGEIAKNRLKRKSE